MGLPARLFLEMEGVFINSRFFRENMAIGRPWGAPRCQHRSATPPAAFAGANCQRSACDAALFPHWVRRQS